MKRKTRKRILSVTALAISAVLILFRTALLSCADDPEDGEKTLPAISVSNLVLFADEDGETVTEEDESTWFRYLYSDRIIVVYEEEEGEEIKKTVYYGLDSLPEDTAAALTEQELQTGDQPWAVGDHTVSLQLGELTTDFTVRVIEKKIRDIVPQNPVLLPKNEDGLYDLSDLELLIYYENSDYYDFITLSDTENALDENQAGPWDSGTHTVDFEYQGFNGSFDAEVTDSPIQSWNFLEAQYWISESAADADSENEEGKLYHPEEFLTLSVVRLNGVTAAGTLKKIAENYQLDYSLSLTSGETEMLFKTGEMSAYTHGRIFGDSG